MWGYGRGQAHGQSSREGPSAPGAGAGRGAEAGLVEGAGPSACRARSGISPGQVQVQAHESKH